MGCFDSVEDGSHRSVQFAQLQPSILQMIRVPSFQWHHNDTSRRIVRLDRHATFLPSTHKIPASTVLPHHFRSMSLVRRRPYDRLPTASDKVDVEVQLLLGEGSIAKKKSQCARALEFLGWIIDLNQSTVTLCDRNLHKFLHALFCFNPMKKSVPSSA